MRADCISVERADDSAELERFRLKNFSASAEDHEGVPVFLARYAYDLCTMIKELPSIRFKASASTLSRGFRARSENRPHESRA